MGGMNSRYIGGRGATGDLTGGGGRSVMPNRDLINNVIARRQRMLEARRRGPALPATQAPYGPLVPPGGGYSGGVIPRFQAGGTPRRTGYAPSSYTSPVDPYGRTWGYNRRGRGKSYDPREQIKATQYALQNYWGQPPGGGYSGGVIPRFQSGDRIRPRFDQFGNRRPVKIRNPNQLGDPGLLEHWQNTNAARRATVAAARRANQAQQQASRSPGGWQEGGQFPEATFPVENQLSDESPWYPDEEVGFEEAAPMQGGFDIFGRSGG